MFKRYKLFTLYLPSLISFLCLIFVVIAISGQTNKARGSVYALQVDFEDLVYSRVIQPENRTLYAQSTLDRTYYIGFWGYCSTDYPGRGNSWLYCTSKDPPYQFDPYQLIEEKGFSYKNRKLINQILLPDGVTMKKSDATVIFAFLWISLGISTAMFLYYCSAWGYRVCKPHDLVVYPAILLNIIFLVVAGAIAQSKFNKVVDSFNKVNGIYGISASFGSKQFYSFIWVSFVLQIIGLFMTYFGNHFLYKDLEYKEFKKTSAEAEHEMDRTGRQGALSTTSSRPRSPSPTQSQLFERSNALERGRGRASTRRPDGSTFDPTRIQRRKETHVETGDAPPRYEDINNDQSHPRTDLPNYAGSSNTQQNDQAGNSSNDCGITIRPFERNV